MAVKNCYTYAPIVSNELVSKIQKFCVQTGSQVFGGLTADSDWDWICSPKLTELKTEIFQNSFKPNGVYKEGEVEGFTSCYLKTLDGRLFNVLVFDNETWYEAWWYANWWMKELCESKSFSEVLKLKENRVEVFRSLKKVYKKTIPDIVDGRKLKNKSN